MFSSDKQKTNPCRNLEDNLTELKKNTTIKGDITSEADFRIDGQLEGHLPPQVK